MSMGMKFFFESSWYAAIVRIFHTAGVGTATHALERKKKKKMNFSVLQSLQD
jgi:hypothetical protein